MVRSPCFLILVLLITLFCLPDCKGHKGHHVKHGKSKPLVETMSTSSPSSSPGPSPSLSSMSSSVSSPSPSSSPGPNPSLSSISSSVLSPSPSSSLGPNPSLSSMSSSISSPSSSPGPNPSLSSMSSSILSPSSSPSPNPSMSSMSSSISSSPSSSPGPNPSLTSTSSVSSSSLSLSPGPSPSLTSTSTLTTSLTSTSTPSTLGSSKLSLDYYKKSCPDFDRIVQENIMTKQLANPTTAAGTLRVFFHDCIVGGCDASLLVSSNSLNKAERDADINLSLPGDAFDVLIRIKTQLELRCPGIVSCADILAEATRDLVTMVGGPYYQIKLGRLDSLTSHASDVAGHISLPNATVSEMIKVFESKGFDVREMVALTGAHTIGFSHCTEFANRLFEYSKSAKVDPSLNPQYAEALQRLCANYKQDHSMAAFNDAVTPGKFDNLYYKNLHRGMGLLQSDQILASDSRTKPIVDQYAANQTAFFIDFARVMEKVSEFKIKTGKDGEIRRRCDVFNDHPGM